ncbi:unnamed protein product [Polarella glacialis]|uniref:non-specific serine/threonine protein kinase n=1 Tax=Polarella glacialis TaxID=89957 RepID=A0A813IKG0_POLGL|nr:unnamed protein product [Polarella glacialis]
MQQRFFKDLGRLEDHYDVEVRKIGRGAFGSVTKGTNRSTGVVRAVKSVVKARATEGSGLEGLEREIELTKTLDHPNIVRLYGAFQDARCIYLIMELCTGGELLDRITERQNIAEPLVAHVMVQILRGVCYMHSRGIAHRDLKPENCVLESRDPLDHAHLKIIDLGLARRFKPTEAMKTVCGTTMYMAPEVISGSYTQSSEYWTCGVILCFLLCGMLPFAGVNDRQLLANISKAVFITHGRLWDPVSEKAKRLVRKFLEKDPGKRISVLAAVEDEWFKASMAGDETEVGALHDDLVENFRAYARMTRFQQAAAAAIAFQISGDEQVGKLRASFQAFDKDNTGTLSMKEMALAFAKDKFSMTLDFMEILGKADANHDGVVSYTEFLAAALWKEIHDNEALCWRAFKSFDLDGDGFISLAELRQILEDDKLGDKTELNIDVEQIYRDMDADHNGKVSFEEFMAMLVGSSRKQAASKAKSECCVVQ